jgi:hypothetical protein
MNLDAYLRKKIQAILTDWRNNDLSYAAALSRLSEYMSVEAAVNLLERT